MRLLTASARSSLIQIALAFSAGATFGQEQPAPSGALAGMVRDTSGRPIVMVRVTVSADTSRTVLTDTAGAYHIDRLPPGIHRVSFRRLGFVPAEFQLLVLSGDVRRATVELVPSPLLLDTVTAVGASVHLALERSGFYDRMRQRTEGAGVGRFVTPEELASVQALTKTTHILESFGVRMIQAERGLSLWPVGAANMILGAGSGARAMGPCQMTLFIDGVEIEFGKYWEGGSVQGLDAFIQPSEIRAIEIYQSASGTPLQFQSVRNAMCGSIVIWTKSG